MATGFEVPVAGAAFGQAKSFFDALAGPKIEEVKRWAKEKDLQKRITPEKLELVFRPYLSRALLEANAIRSVVFPQHHLPIEQIYEPLSLENSHINNIFHDRFLDLYPRAIIVDGAGMGKTTFAKFLFKTVALTRSQIPILCNLRNVKEEDIFSYTRAQLDEFDNHFDHEIYSRLIRNGKFFFIFDGFDEVLPRYQDGVRSNLEQFSLRAPACPVLITSRKQANLPLPVGGIEFRLSPLARTQAESLVARYDSYADLDVGRRLTEQFDRVPSELLATPLYIALLYRTFAETGEISSHVTRFYSDVFEALYRGHDLLKAGFVRERVSGLDIDEFRRNLQAFSFYCLIAGTVSWTSEEQLVDSITKSLSLTASRISPRDFARDMMVAVPMLLLDGREYRFVHRTFAEYFAAEFIVISPDSEGFLKQIIDSDVWRTFTQSWDYLAEIAPALFRRVFTAPLGRKLLQHDLASHWSPLQMCKEAFVFVLYAGHRTAGDARQHIPHATNIHAIRIDSADTKVTIACGRNKSWEKVPKYSLMSLTKPFLLLDKIEDEHRAAGIDALSLRLGKSNLQFLDGDDLERLFENPYLADAFANMGAGLLTGDVSSNNSIPTIDEAACRRVLEDEHTERSRVSDVAALVQAARRDG